MEMLGLLFWITVIALGIFYTFRRRPAKTNTDSDVPTEFERKVARVLVELRKEFGTIANLPRTTIAAKFGTLEYWRATKYIDVMVKEEKIENKKIAEKNKIKAKTMRARGEHHLANGGKGTPSGGVGPFVGATFGGEDE